MECLLSWVGLGGDVSRPASGVGGAALEEYYDEGGIKTRGHPLAARSNG